MPYKLLPTLSLLVLIQAYGEGSITTTPCSSPATATEDLNQSFRYGCFCGENYPTIEHPSKKSYRDLNQTERKRLIQSYQQITPYDDIDRICQAHDICYVQEGRKSRSCNEKLSQDLLILEQKFNAQSEQNLSNEQCRNLAFDIASVFNTIFAPSDDDDTIFDLGMLMVNGAIISSNKILQASSDTLSDYNNSHYPKQGEKCLVNQLKRKGTIPIEFKEIKIRTIERTR